MASETNASTVTGKRPAPWKRRLRIVDLTVGIALIAADFALLRASDRGSSLAVASLVGLLALMVGFVWRYVPVRWERPCYYAALVLYVGFLGLYVASLAAPLRRAFGIQ
jgi:hypothetical protein